MTTASYSVEVSWENKVDGIFTIGESGIYSDPTDTDVLAYDFGDTAYDDITDDVKSIRIWRGRSGDFAAMDAGQCEIVLTDPDQRYNPRKVGTTRNLITNPSIEVNATGYYQGGGGTVDCTFDRSSEAAYLGSYGLYWSPGSDTTSTAYAYWIKTFTPAAGDVYSGGVWVKAVGSAVGRSMRVFIREQGGAAAVADTSTNFVASGSWQWVTVTHTVQESDRTSLVLFVRYYSGAADTDIWYLDNWQLEQSATAHPYCDGDQDLCRWTGTPHASTTIYGNPLYGKLVPLRPVRVRATYDGTTYGLFHGFLTEIRNYGYLSRQETVFRCTDAFEQLHRSRVTIATLTNNTPDQIMGSILTACKIPLMRRNLSASSGTIPSWGTDGSTDMLSEIQDILAINQGVFYFDGSGVATYKTPTEWYTQDLVSYHSYTTSVVRDTTGGITPDGLINSQTVLRTGGTAQTYSDADSIDTYGYCHGAPIESALLDSDARALALATFIVGISHEPRVPAWNVDLLNSSATNMPLILGTELGDTGVAYTGTATYTNPGVVESIEHEITDGFQIHRAAFTVREYPGTVPSYP